MPARKHGIVFVCGAFHEPVCFDQAKDRLLSSGFNVVLVPKVASVGEEGSGKSAADDAKAIQAQIQPYIDDGHELIVIGHSYGAYPGWAATEGLTVAERAAAGEKGGVRAFVGVAAGLPLRPGSSPRVVSESADNQTVYPPFCNHGPRGNVCSRLLFSFCADPLTASQNLIVSAGPHRPPDPRSSQGNLLQ